MSARTGTVVAKTGSHVYVHFVHCSDSFTQGFALVVVNCIFGVVLGDTVDSSMGDFTMRLEIENCGFGYGLYGIELKRIETDFQFI